MLFTGWIAQCTAVDLQFDALSVRGPTACTNAAAPLPKPKAKASKQPPQGLFAQCKKVTAHERFVVDLQASLHMKQYLGLSTLLHGLQPNQQHVKWCLSELVINDSFRYSFYTCVHSSGHSTLWARTRFICMAWACLNVLHVRAFLGS